MVNLVVDAGNTNIKLFLFENDLIVFKYIFSNTSTDFDDKIQSFLLSKNISYCIISSVNKINEKLLFFLENNLNTIFFTHGMNLPVDIEYKTPETLGLDRLASVVGADALFPGKNILVIDAGTAITYDLVLNKKYLGGTISPGILTRFKALHTFTEKLPLLNINEEEKGLYGNTTKSAIILGVQNGVMYEIMGNIKAFKEKYNDLAVIFTGGDTFFFEKSFKFCIFVEPNLTAIGLNKILKLNV
ncbi:MAG: type III pantothenate kinase [Bacteroidales bacterium]|jgi:type III pantothenate kinase|nr:type III pantothenate kinase [Bacteroidales bacterium]